MAEKNKTPKTPAPKAAKVRMPEKATINFVHHESVLNPRTLLPVIILASLVLVVFAKFGILDPINLKTDAYSRLSAAQEQVAAYNALLAEYPEVYEKYGRYSYGWMNDEHVRQPNRLDVIAMVEECVMPYGDFGAYAFTADTVTMSVSGISLARLSDMAEKLEAHPLVAGMTVYSATSPNGKTADASISITLKMGQ